MHQHEIYIKYCIEIAKNGLGYTRPNPMVGSVIVYNDKIIGSGFTSKYGGHHAEVNAINSVLNKDLLKKATLYVTLEPCSHYGNTPPCCDLIIKHKIPNIVIGCLDENEKVAGNGIKKLKKSGCHVTLGVLEDACKQHHKRFLTFHTKKRPYIILKWAVTADGFIAPKSKKTKNPVWITNTLSRQRVHKWRAEEQAILVGTNTVLEDNPSLTTRDWFGVNPIKIIIDKNERIPKHLRVFKTGTETILINNETINFEEPIAKQICEVLFSKSISSVIVEGGTKTIQTFINEGFWDEARVFSNSKMFHNGTKAPYFKGKLISTERIQNDFLKIYSND